MKARLACVFCGAVMLTGCPLLFSFDRDAGLITGSIRGQSLRTDVGAEEPASFVRVHTVGAGRDQFTATDGTFRVQGLSVGNWVLRLRDDRDGNGWPERTMTVATRLVAWAPPLTIAYEDQDVVQSPLLVGQSITVPGAVAGEDAPREPIGIDLGGVRLEATFPVKGQVLLGDEQLPPDASELLGRVYVVRSACFTEPAEGETAAPVVVSQSTCPTDFAGIAEALQLGADAWVPVDANGDFAFPAVASGTFALVPMVFAVPGVGDAVEEPLFIGTPLVLDGAPPDEGVQFEVGVLSLPGVAADAPVVSDTRGVEIIIAPDPLYLLTDEAVGAGGYLMQTLDDRRAPPCLPFVPDQALPGFVDTHIVPLSDPSRSGDRISVNAELQQGVWDLRLCIPSVGEGGLDDVMVLPPNGTQMIIGPVLLIDPEITDEADRDGDGIRGLPLLEGLSGEAWEEVRDVWAACGDSCASPEAYDVDNGPATCDVDIDGDGTPETIDCDDDGDGQPDVTEAPRCLGTGRGPDYDSDGLCGSEDPFPYCTLNTAAACTSSIDVVVTTTLSPTLLDPTCQPTIDVQLGDRYCEAVGTGQGDCGRFSMVCQPTYLVRAACLIDSDCAGGERCRFGRCYASSCDGGDPESCGGGAVCVAPEEVCLPRCNDDGDCANDTVCTSAFPGAPAACYPEERGGEGAPCAISTQCQQGFSCIETCAGLGVDGVELPPACGEGGDLEGLSFCQRDCSVDDPSSCRADQRCVPGAFGLSGQCWFPAVDITCECHDSVSGRYRPVRVDAVLEASSCTVEGVDELWRQCTAFIDDPENLGLPYEPDPEPDPEPTDAGMMDAGDDDAGLPDDGGAPDDGDVPPFDGGFDAGTVAGVDDAGLPPPPTAAPAWRARSAGTGSTTTAWVASTTGARRPWCSTRPRRRFSTAARRSPRPPSPPLGSHRCSRSGPTLRCRLGPRSTRRPAWCRGRRRPPTSASRRFASTSTWVPTRRRCWRPGR